MNRSQKSSICVDFHHQTQFAVRAKIMPTLLTTGPTDFQLYLGHAPGFSNFLMEECKDGIFSKRVFTLILKTKCETTQ